MRDIETLLRFWVFCKLSQLYLLFLIEMFFWSMTCKLSSKTWLFELSETRSVKEFRLFVFSKFTSLLLLGFEFWTLIVSIKNTSLSLREPSWTVLSLYSWFSEWMPFFLLQHLAKDSCLYNCCKLYHMLDNYLYYVFHNRICISWRLQGGSVKFRKFISLVDFRILCKISL